MLTDIIQEGTEILVVGDSLDRVREAFGIDLRDGREWLKGVMSRKKQIIPPLEKSFNDGLNAISLKLLENYEREKRAQNEPIQLMERISLIFFSPNPHSAPFFAPKGFLIKCRILSQSFF